MPMVAVGVAGVLLLAGAGYGLLRPKPVEKVEVSNAPPPVTATRPEPTTAPEPVTVHFLVAPKEVKDARLEVDGNELPAGANTLTMKADSRNHVVRVRAAGYKDGERSFTTSDASVPITLEKAAPGWVPPRIVDKPKVEDKKTEVTTPPPPPPPEDKKKKLDIDRTGP